MWSSQNIKLTRSQIQWQFPLHRQPNRSKDVDILVCRSASREREQITIPIINPANIGQTTVNQVLTTYHMGHDRDSMAFRKRTEVVFPRIDAAMDPANAYGKRKESTLARSMHMHGDEIVIIWDRMTAKMWWLMIWRAKAWFCRDLRLYVCLGSRHIVISPILSPTICYEALRIWGEIFLGGTTNRFEIILWKR